MLAARYAVEAHTFHGGDVFRKVPNRFHDFSPPPWGRAYPEALTCLWVLVIVTFRAEATGTVRIIVADQ